LDTTPLEIQRVLRQRLGNERTKTKQQPIGYGYGIRIGRYLDKREQKLPTIDSQKK
jgi:hypothetical protein